MGRQEVAGRYRAEKKSTPTARTSGSANGSSITTALLVAAALTAATVVAVAPTPADRPQLLRVV